MLRFHRLISHQNSSIISDFRVEFCLALFVSDWLFGTNLLLFEI